MELFVSIAEVPEVCILLLNSDFTGTKRESNSIHELCFMEVALYKCQIANTT